jgi:hypothetical protein
MPFGQAGRRKLRVWELKLLTQKGGTSPFPLATTNWLLVVRHSQTPPSDFGFTFSANRLVVFPGSA